MNCTKEILDFYRDWCKETGRNGGVLIGTSIKELLTALTQQVTAALAEQHNRHQGYEQELSWVLNKYNLSGLVLTAEAYERVRAAMKEYADIVNPESAPQPKEGVCWTDRDMRAAHEQGWLKGIEEHALDLPTCTASRWLTNYEKSHERYAIKLSNDRKAAIEKEGEKEAFADLLNWMLTQQIKYNILGWYRDGMFNYGGYMTTSDLITIYKSSLEKDGKP